MSDSPALRPVTAEPHPLACLTALTSITYLWVSEPDGPACEAVALLTNLKELAIINPCYITRAGFGALTALGRLTCLGFRGEFNPLEVAVSVQNGLDDDVPGCNRGLLRKVSLGRKPCEYHRGGVRRLILVHCSTVRRVFVAWGRGEGG